MELFLRKGRFMQAVLGTKENPIKIGCAEVRKSGDKIGDCVIKAIQSKIGLDGKVFKDRRYKYIAIVIKTNNCNNCLLGMNTCNVSKVVLPKKAIEERMAVAV